jgi:hypothetical protein
MDIAAMRIKMAHYVPWIQGIYYLLMGIWPLLGIISFQRVTGPKTDLWLVYTVGLLLAVIGCAIMLSAYRRKIPHEIAFLAIGTAVVLVGIEVVFIFKGIISAIYLLDTVVQGVLILSWLQRLNQDDKVVP